MFSAVGVIPARYGSSRLPGKPLADLQGKPLLYHVYHRASRARTLERVFVATDDERIAEAARSFGAVVVMTRPDHRTGTDRIAEALGSIQADIVVNIQGDEPLIDVSSIDQVVSLLQANPQAEMSTLKAPIEDVDDLWNPNIVKVVTDENHSALYFSRSPIPFVRDRGLSGDSFRETLLARPELLCHFFRHIGLYAFRGPFLQRFASWKPSTLEMLEDLEQLRALEHGASIKVGMSKMKVVGIDTPEDLERIRRAVGLNPALLDA